MGRILGQPLVPDFVYEIRDEFTVTGTTPLPVMAGADLTDLTSRGV